MARALQTVRPGRRRPGHPKAGGVSCVGRCDEGWRLQPRPCERGCPAAVRRTAAGGRGAGPGAGCARGRGGPSGGRADAAAGSSRSRVI